MSLTVQGEPIVWPNGELVDVASIEAYADEARQVTHPLDDGLIRTPDWVIAALADVSRWASRMVVVTKNAELLKRMRSADLAEKKAQAVVDAAAYPVREQASRVVLATIEERRAYDRAVVAFEEARRVGNLLAGYTSRVQSTAKMVELTYRDGA